MESCFRGPEITGHPGVKGAGVSHIPSSSAELSSPSGAISAYLEAQTDESVPTIITA
jgi:hypothetical protein